MGPASRAVKRGFDVAASLAALVVAAPAIALIAVAVRLESRGPALYTQRRVGRDGRPFEIHKFRTMVTGAEFIGAGLAVQEGDDRITRVGALLRRTSLDELPNLLDVLRGDMSMVGPRPTVQVQVDHYSERQRGRLRVKPGLTGWAQLHGRASLPWSQRIELDLWYVEHQSLALDARILARTPAMLLSGRGLYKGEGGGWDLTGEVPQQAGEGYSEADVPRPASEAPSAADVPQPASEAPSAADVPQPASEAPSAADVPRPASGEWGGA